MGHLYRYIFRQLVWWTLVVSATMTCIVWLTQSLRFVEMIVNRGLSATTFITFTLLLLPSFLSVIGPIALFAAIMFTYNRMIGDSEIVILRASGMSPGRIGWPALAITILMTILGYFNSLYLMPASFREFKDMQRNFRTEFSSVFLQEGVFNPVAKGITVFVRERGNNGELKGVIIHDERVKDKPTTMMAEKGAIVTSTNGPRVLMINGNRQAVASKNGRLSLLYFDRYTFDLSSLNDTDIGLWREPRERYMHELFFPESQSKTLFNYQKLRMEGLFRLSAPLLYFAYTLIGLSLLLGATFNRRGHFQRNCISICLVIAVQVTMLGLKSLGEKIPKIEPFLYIVPIGIIIAFLILLIPISGTFKRKKLEFKMADP